MSSSSSSSASYWANRTAWVTGASSGIGEAVALELHRRGARLVISARRTEELARVRDLCVRRHGDDGTARFEPIVLPLDLSDLASLPDKAREAALRLGRPVQAIVHCGGRGMRAEAIETSSAVERELMTVNFFAVVELTRAVLPDMVCKRDGAIVVISSVQGRIALPGRSAYSASKHALHGYFNSLRMELRHTGVQVTLALPGYVATNFSVAAANADGSAYNVTDSTTAAGYPPAFVACHIADAVERRQREVWIMQLKGRLAIWLSVLAPALLEWALSKGIGHASSTHGVQKQMS